MNSNSGLQKVRMILFGFLMLFILNPISVSANGVANYVQTECQFRYCGTAIPFLTVRSTAR